MYACMSRWGWIDACMHVGIERIDCIGWDKMGGMDE